MDISYEPEIKVLLSEDVYKAFLEAVDEGKIDQQKAETIAGLLHPTVRGNFRRQVSSDSTVFNRDHIRKILSDWYMHSALYLSHPEAVECLINVLKHDNLGRNENYFVTRSLGALRAPDF